MSSANIFTHYKQLENHFTNGFVSILGLSRFESPSFVASFLRDELGIALDGEIDMFRVLPGEEGTADGELRGKECCLWLETKIASHTLCEEQIRRHLEGDPRYLEGDVRRKGTLHIFEHPIPLSDIRMVKGFEKFGLGQSAFHNITHEQYRELMKQRSDTGLNY